MSNPLNGLMALSLQVAKSQFKDCCDCIYEKQVKSKRCRKCFDDPARPSFWAKCGRCKGTGKSPYDFDNGADCELCDGTGRIPPGPNARLDRQGEAR